ncbi:helix-turn-helix domain-containing protein [Sphingomonas oligophenolica]|uniref:Helix-turn-helix domain-containing protein n=1 Tax=Sphingomonas oligophenolica TaxID=301154 RepID=A0ABU9Y3E0_9SPHN
MSDAIERAQHAKRGSPFLNTAQAAHFLGISVRSMERMRARGTGPPPRRHARMVQYHIDDLQAWSRSCTD